MTYSNSHYARSMPKAQGLARLNAKTEERKPKWELHKYIRTYISTYIRTEIVEDGT